MSDRVSFPVDLIAHVAERNRTEREKSAIWCAASKGVIFALIMERVGCPVDTVIDINPAKQGKFLAGTGLLVKSPEQGLAELCEGSTIYVMNTNYLDEIMKVAGNRFNHVGIDHE